MSVGHFIRYASLLCCRRFGTTCGMQKRKNKHMLLREQFENEVSLNPNFPDEIENLSNALINDTKRSVAAKLTKTHDTMRTMIKARIIHRKNFRYLLKIE